MRQLFVSDLHLQPERPEITRAFLYFLDQIVPGADELYLLGDIFEYWIGDDSPLPGLEPITSALQHCSAAGTKLFFQHGNRDFLVGAAYLQLVGADLLPEQQRIDTPAGSALLLHGDQLCSADLEYQQFRRLVRTPEWQQQFLAKPVSERLAIARQLREKSSAEGAMKDLAIMDVNADAVIAAMAQAEVHLLIHGHTHRPAIHRLANQAERIVLGDWSNWGWYLEIDSNGHKLVRFSSESGERRVHAPVYCHGTPL